MIVLSHYIVYYLIRFFICFPFILLFLKLYLSFILPEELKKLKKGDLLFDRSCCSCFLDDARKKFYLHYPWYYLWIMKYQYTNLIFVSEFIFYLVTFDLQADAEKNMLRDVNI